MTSRHFWIYLAATTWVELSSADGLIMHLWPRSRLLSPAVPAQCLHKLAVREQAPGGKKQTRIPQRPIQTSRVCWSLFLFLTVAPSACRGHASSSSLTAMPSAEVTGASYLALTEYYNHLTYTRLAYACQRHEYPQTDLFFWPRIKGSSFPGPICPAVRRTASRRGPILSNMENQPIRSPTSQLKVAARLH
ncbi:hypothetical protein J3F83DRAFT_149294 [Trichoderma novae-zelandiae]